MPIFKLKQSYNVVVFEWVSYKPRLISLKFTKPKTLKIPDTNS